MKLFAQFAIAALASIASAQSVTTATIQGTVYQANGAVASGTLQLSWPAFTTAANQAIAAGRLAVPIATDGTFSVNLAPNAGATPAGLFYTAVFNLSTGSTSTEYWVVPAAAQATLAQVRAQVMPAAQAVQAVSKSYVDSALARVIPATGGAVSGPLTATQLGAVYQADQFTGADLGAKLQSCLGALNSSYGGTCDARNAASQTIGSPLAIGTPNAHILLPCATITTAYPIVIPAGVRNVVLEGCSYQGGSSAGGTAGGTVWIYTGSGTAIQIGDPTYAQDTKGFTLKNVNLNTASAAASAQGMAFYRTEEIRLDSLYLNGNGGTGQIGITLDGTGNYTGGSFLDVVISNFNTGWSLTGHLSGSAAGDFANAGVFLRTHVNCPTSNGSPIAGTTGINVQAGDGNSWIGGDVEGCATMFHLGPNAVNNTIDGLRNENSTVQYQADAGSSYNAVFTGGTFFTGKLIDNGSRNSFWDAFHRTVNGMKGDWYASQQDATVINHLRLGTGAGNVRGLQWETQVDQGTSNTVYNWLWGLTDGTSGQSNWIYQDLINNVLRLQIQQNNTAGGNNPTAISAAGTGNVCFNCAANAGTGGVAFSSGGATPTTVATVDNAGNAQFTGTLQVGGTTQSTGTLIVRNNADAEVDYYLRPGLTASQKGSFTYKDYDGSSQWYMVKDQNNNWALNSAIGGLDSFKAYQSTNSGDTYINAANTTGHIRLNYESGSGSETDIYSNGTLDAAFLGNTAIKFPGLAASAGHNCLQIDNSGYLTNTGAGCATPTLSATTGSIGGSALSPGCTNQSAVTVTGATTSMVCRMSGAGGTQPANIQPQCYVSAANTVTPQLCTAVATTPAAQTYNIRVNP